MLTRNQIKQLQVTDPATVTLPPEIWMRIAVQLKSVDIRSLSLSSRSLHNVSNCSEMQVQWLLQHRLGKELLAATHVGMAVSTIRALLDKPGMLNTYKNMRSSKAQYGPPSLLANCAHNEDTAGVSLLLDMGLDIDEVAGWSCAAGQPAKPDTHSFYWVSCVKSKDGDLTQMIQVS